MIDLLLPKYSNEIESKHFNLVLEGTEEFIIAVLPKLFYYAKGNCALAYPELFTKAFQENYSKNSPRTFEVIKLICDQARQEKQSFLPTLAKSLLDHKTRENRYRMAKRLFCDLGLDEKEMKVLQEALGWDDALVAVIRDDVETMSP